MAATSFRVSGGVGELISGGAEMGRTLCAPTELAESVGVPESGRELL